VNFHGPRLGTTPSAVKKASWPLFPNFAFFFYNEKTFSTPSADSGTAFPRISGITILTFYREATQVQEPL
jgi:hypothetical protein